VRTLLLPTKVKRLSQPDNRWIVRIPSGPEKNLTENYLAYIGNEPFWFDGGGDGNIDPAVFVGHGNGRQTQFYLRHEFVIAPTLVVYVDDAMVPNWELKEHSGLLTFHAPPRPRSRVTAKYRCHFKCIGFRRDSRTIEIRQVGLFGRTGRRVNGDGARRIIAEFLNFKPNLQIDQDSPLYWLLYQSKEPKQIELLQHCLQRVLEPIIAPKPTHDPRSSRYLRSLVISEVLASCPKSELRLSLEKIVQRALVDGKFRTLRTCNSCNIVFVAKHGRTRVCSKSCKISRDKQQHKIRQHRYLGKKLLQQK
jgi:hypothetical protein